MRVIGASTLALFAASCVSAPPREPLPVTGDAAPFAASGAAALEQRWWTAFGDADLDARMERALSDNLSLRAAWRRVEEARALVRFTDSARGPRLDGVATGALFDGSESQDSSRVSLGLEASWELDLFGRIDALVEADALLAAATEADYRAIAVGLSADVALTWYQLAEAREQRALVESQLDANESVLALLEARFGIGESDSADVLRQRQLVEATREQLVVIDARVEVLEHRLAILEGRAPQEVVELAPALPTLPDLPSTGLPSELLERRPDVRAAFLRLEAADAEVSAAVRDTYPRIDLSAGIATIATRPSGLFEDWLADLTASLVAPLYDSGRRRAEVDRAVAARRRLLAEYGDRVLVAFAEVEDALAQERLQVRRIASLEQQVTLAEGTYRQLRTQYLGGAAEYIDVLIALRELQGLRRDRLAARLDRVALRIALHRALAGGFATPYDEDEGSGEHESVRDDDRD